RPDCLFADPRSYAGSPRPKPDEDARGRSFGAAGEPGNFPRTGPVVAPGGAPLLPDRYAYSSSELARGPQRWHLPAGRNRRGNNTGRAADKADLPWLQDCGQVHGALLAPDGTQRCYGCEEGESGNP